VFEYIYVLWIPGVARYDSCSSVPQMNSHGHGFGTICGTLPFNF